MLILGFDTSGSTASAALLRDDLLLAQTSLYTKRTHSQIMLPLCREMLKNAEVSVEEIDLFAAANGPGSYTGLRIGLAAVKGMAFALGKPCVGVSTLSGLAWLMAGTQGKLCSVIHARQSLYYCAVFESDGTAVSRVTEDAILEETALAELLESYHAPVLLNGDGAERIAALSEQFTAAPPHLRLQSAVGIALAARELPHQDAVTLAASYLQETQAEKLRR